MDEIFRLSVHAILLALLPFTAAVVISTTAVAVVTRLFRLEAEVLLYGVRLAAFVAVASLFAPSLSHSLKQIYQVAFEYAGILR